MIRLRVIMSALSSRVFEREGVIFNGLIKSLNIRYLYEEKAREWTLFGTLTTY